LLGIDERGLVVFETNEAGFIVRVTVNVQALKVKLMIVLRVSQNADHFVS